MTKGTRVVEYEYITCSKCGEKKHRGLFKEANHKFNGKTSRCRNCITGADEDEADLPREHWIPEIPDTIEHSIPHQ